MHTKSKKSQGTHIKKIQAFQKNFETIYNSFELRWTIYDATLTLKHNVTEKLPNMKILPYVKDMYTFDLKFYFPNFLPLPTCEFGLDFLPPFPD